MQRLAQHVPLVPIAEGLLWHTLAWWRALFMPAAFAGGISIKANNLSDCRQQTTVPNSALPCCRFMCTPHWQLFYLGVSTVLGGQGSVPQLANTSLCCSLLLRLLNVGSCAWLAEQLFCNTSHLHCCAKVEKRSCSTSDASVVNPTCDGPFRAKSQPLGRMLTLLVLS